MNRCLAFLFAVLIASITISSACVAQPSEWVRFTLHSRNGDGRLQANFSDESKGRGDNRRKLSCKHNSLRQPQTFARKCFIGRYSNATGPVSR